MIYCVMAQLQFDTPAETDKMTTVVADKLVGKLLWGMVKNIKGIDTETGKPSSLIEIRFEYKADAWEVFNLIKDKIIKIPELCGSVSIHLCGHDEHKECTIWGRYIKV